MTPSEILSKIAWAPDADPTTRQAVEDAILRMAGGNRPTFDSMTVHRRLEKFVAQAGSANKAAARLGIGKSFMCDIRCGNRPVPDSVLRVLGIEKVKSRDLFRDL